MILYLFSSPFCFGRKFEDKDFVAFLLSVLRRREKRGEAREHFDVTCCDVWCDERRTERDKRDVTTSFFFLLGTKKRLGINKKCGPHINGIAMVLSKGLSLVGTGAVSCLQNETTFSFVDACLTHQHLRYFT